VNKRFDLAIPGPTRPIRDTKKRRREEEPRPPPATQAIWSCLLDHGTDPLVLAALLRESVSVNDRRRAYYDLVRDVGPLLAEQAWEEAFAVRDRLSRRAFPVGVREIAEAALGTPLVGIHVVTGELVDLVATRLETPAFSVGSEVFVRGDALTGRSQAVLVHEAIHAAQQGGASADKPAAPDRGAEDDAHRVLRRIGPLDGAERISRERARASTVVRAALGRAPKLLRRPQSVAAYEPTAHESTGHIVDEAKQLADAVVALLERNAAIEELKAALGPVAEDDTATRIFKVALQLLADRSLKGGKNARGALLATLGELAALAFRPSGKPLPGDLKNALEPRLGKSLAGVRLHDDEKAAQKTREAGAVALAQGRDVYFAPGKLDFSTEEGRRLLGHELAHVAQQAGAPAARDGEVSAPGSAVEKEAERVGKAFASGQGDFTVRESAPAGTVSRDDGKPSGHLALRMLDQSLDLDVASAVDWAGGRKKLTLPKAKLGPVSLDEITVELDGSTVKRGFLKASLDDGHFKGSRAELQVDKNGQVSGRLDLDVQVPGALAKKLQIDMAQAGTRLSVLLNNGDFLSRELPVTASAMNIRVTQSETGFDVQLDGSVKVKLDKGFAEASGTMTAQLVAGPGGVAIDATVEADVRVAGLGEAHASLKWNGRETTLRLTTGVKILGLSGTAALTYKGGKLHGEIGDLQFDLPALKPLKFGPVSIADGKLHAHVEVPDGTTFAVPGAKAIFSSQTQLDLDGDKLNGAAAGRFELGPLSGDFHFSYADGAFDGRVDKLTASLPFLKVSGVSIGVKGLGRENQLTVGGEINVEVAGGKIKGKWSHLAWSGSSLTGQVTITVDLPQLQLPPIELEVQPGWKVHGKLPDLVANLNLGGDLGVLSSLGIHVQLRDGDLARLPEVLGELTAKAATVPLPKLASFGSVENLELKIPRLAGGYDFASASGSATLRITKFGTPVSIRLELAQGKLSAKGGATVDVHQLLPRLKGSAEVRFDGGKLEVTGRDISLADGPLAGKAKCAEFKYADGEVSARFTAAGVELAHEKLSVTVDKGEVVLKNGDLSGELSGSMNVAGHKVTATVAYQNGALTFKGGQLTLPLAKLAPGLLAGTATLDAAADGDVAAQLDGARVVKTPLQDVQLGGATFNTLSKRFSAALAIKDGKPNIKGFTVSNLSGSLKVVGNQESLGLDGALSADATLSIGGKPIVEGALRFQYQGGKFSGSITGRSAKLDLGPSVKVGLSDFNVGLKEDGGVEVSGKPRLTLKAGEWFDGWLEAVVAANEVKGFNVDGTFAESSLWQAASLKSLKFENGGLAGQAKATLKALGEIQAGAELSIGLKAGALSAWAENVAFTTGKLKGWTLSGGLQNGKFSATVSAPAAGFALGPLTVKIDAGAKLGFDEAAGISGELSGAIALKGNAVKVKARFAHNDLDDLTVDGEVDIHSFIPALKGKLQVAYKKGAAEPVEIHGSGITASDPKIGKYLQVKEVHYAGGRLSGEISFNSPEFELKGKRLQVVSSTVKFVDTTFSGQLRLRVAGAKNATNVTVTVEPDGSFGDIAFDSTVDLSTVSKKLKGIGTLKASAASGLQELECAEATYEWRAGKTVALYDIKYQKQPEIFSAGLRLGKDEIQLPNVTLSDAKIDVHVKKSGEGVAVDGSIESKAAVVAGGKELIKGTAKIAYHGGAVSGTLQVDSAKVGVGPVEVTLKSTTISYDPEKGVTGNVNASLQIRSRPVDLELVMKDNQLTDIKIAAQLDLHTIVPQLKGSLSLKYAAGAIEIEGKDVTASHPVLQKYVKVDHFRYAGGKLSATVSVSSGELATTISGKTVKGRITEGHLTFADDKLSGSIKCELEMGGVGKAKGVITLKEDGSLDVKGSPELDVGPLTGHFCEGVLKASNEDGVQLSGNIRVAKGPLANKLEVVASYDSNEDKMTAGFAFKEAALPKLAGVTLSGISGTLQVTSTKGVLSVDGTAKGHARIKDYLEGDFELGYVGGKFFGSFKPTKLNLNLGPAKTDLGSFGIAIDEAVKLHAHGEISVKYGDTVDARLQIGVSAGGITKVQISGAVHKTKFTKEAKLDLGYENGAFSGHADVYLSDLGGAIDPDAKLTAEGESGKGLKLSAKDVAFKKGLLKGWTIHSAELSGDKLSAEIGAPGTSFEFAGVKVKIDAGAKILVDSDKGLGGHVSGSIDVPKIGPILFTVDGDGNGVRINATTKEIQLNTLVKILEGTVQVGVTDNQFTFKAHDVKIKEPTVERILTIDHLEYKNGNFDAQITVNHVQFTAGGAQATVESGSVKFNGGKLEGEIKGRVVLANGQKLEVLVGFKNGELVLDVGGEFELGQYTKEALHGKVKASTAGNLQALSAITFNPDGPLKILKDVTITALHGDVKKGHFTISVELTKAVKAFSTSMLQIELTKANGTFTYDNGAISGGGGVEGQARIKVGSRQISGKFAVSYKDGKLNGKVSDLKADLGTAANKYAGIDPGGSIDTESGEVKANFWVKVPGVLKKSPLKVHINVKDGSFSVVADLHLDVEALKDILLHVEVKSDGTLVIKAKLEGAKTIKLPAGGELTLDAGSNLGFDGEKVAGALKGSAKLGRIADGTFDFTIDGGSVNGKLDLKLKELPMLKPGVEIHAVFKDNKISTAAPIKLEFSDTISKFVDGTMSLEIHDNKVKASGAISRIKNLGSVGDQVKGGKVEYNDGSGDIDIEGTIDLHRLPGIDQGQLTLGSKGGELYAAGKVKFKPIGSTITMSGGFEFEWRQGRAKISGGMEANIKGLAELSLKVTNDPKSEGAGDVEVPEGSSQFMLSGKLTVTGLMAKFPQIQFAKPPSVAFWVKGGDGAVDYGMDDFETTIVKLPGVDKCNIAVSASYNKTDGFDASVDLGTVKIKMFKLSGGISIKHSKFEEAHLKIESDFPSVNLVGEVTIHAGDLDRFNAEASLKVEPGSGSGLKWLEQGSASVKFKDGHLAEASGSLTLRKPPLLPLEKTELEIHKDGEDITGSVESEFKIPFGTDKKGKLKVTFGGPQRWSVELTAEIKPPGFKAGLIHGFVDANGHFEVGGSLQAEGDKLLRAASVRLGYSEAKGFYIGGSVTLRINDKLAGEVDVEYDQATDDFLFKGTIKPIQEPEPPDVKELYAQKWKRKFPLWGVGFANVVLEISAGISFNMEMPHLDFRELTLKGSLKSVLSGKLPEIGVKAFFGMGVSAAFEIGVGLAGQIQLLIAEADAGIKGVFKASAGLKIGLNVEGILGGDHDGIDITFDPVVTPHIELEAILRAYFHAEAFWFTIIDKEWDLARFQLDSFDLPAWHPFEPQTLNLGGSGPMFKDGDPQPKSEMPPGLEDGAKKGGNQGSDEAKNGETKQKVRPVMEAIKTAAAKLEQLPPNWREGMTEPPSIEEVWLVPGEARQLYANKADDAERWFPELAAKTPAEKLAKNIAVNGIFGIALAATSLMGWRRAQIAHMGVDPDTGVDVVALRAQVQEAQDAKHAADVEAAIAAQQAQDEEWAAAVKKQEEDFQKAEKEHEKKFEQIRREYQLKVKQLEEEASLAEQKLEEAEKQAKKEGAQERATEQEKAPPPPPPPAPEPPPPLVKPDSIPKKPPIPIPVAPPPVAPVVVPPLPDSQLAALSFGGGGTAAVKPPAPPPSPPEPKPQAPAPPSGKGASVGAQVESKGGGGGGGGSAKANPTEMGIGAPKGPKGGGGGGPARVEGPGNVSAQQKALAARLASYGAGAAAGAAAAAGAPAAASGAPAAASPAGSPAGGGGAKNAPAGAKAAPAAAKEAAPDATVQRVVDAGKQAEESRANEAKQKEAEFKQKITQKTQVAGKGEAKLKEAAAKKHEENERNQRKAEEAGEHRTVPPDAAFPAGEAAQARVAFSNWIRLALTGESLLRFTERMAGRSYFDFEKRAWGSVIDEFKKLFDASKPEDPLPEPKELAERLYAGHSWTGKEYQPVAGFDPGYSLSDDSIKAWETLGKFKDLYRGSKAADYLAAEADKLDPAQKTSFVNSKLAAICGAAEPMKALRLALERLGPAVEVTGKLAEIDSGKGGVDATGFWAAMSLDFNAMLPGLEQVTAVIDKLLGRPPGAPEAPAMLRWAEAQRHFEALDDGALEALLSELGAQPGTDLAGNQAALLDRRKAQVETLAAAEKQKQPEQLFAAWVAENHPKTIAVNRAVAALAAGYARKIEELRRQSPRLDSDAVTRAAAAFRRRIGSNALVWALGELNPNDCHPAEKVDPSVALLPVEGADWNPLLDSGWLSGTYEKIDPALFKQPAAPQAEKQEAPKADPKNDQAQPDNSDAPQGPKPEVAADGKPDEKKEKPDEKKEKPDEKKEKPADEQLDKGEKTAQKTADDKPPAPDELKAADERLRTALKQCLEPPPALKAMAPKDKVTLSAKPEPEVRKQLFPDFQTLKPSLEPAAIERCAQLDEEKGLAPGYEALPSRFTAELHQMYLDGDEAADFQSLITNLVKTGKGNGDGYLLKGKPIDQAAFETIAPDDKSLTRVVSTAAINESVLNLAAVRAGFDKARPDGEGRPEELVAFALERIQSDPATYIQLYCNGPQLVRFPSWLSPEPQIKSDAVFTEYSDLQSLYANWSPEGQLRMTLKRESVLKKIADKQLKKPTAFDGAVSPTWLERERRDQSWGTTGGGLREALMKVDWDDVDHSKWVCVEIDAKHRARRR
jgi:hypothetical protein